MYEIIHRSLQLALVILNLLVKLCDSKTIAAFRGIIQRCKHFFKNRHKGKN